MKNICSVLLLKNYLPSHILTRIKRNCVSKHSVKKCMTFWLLLLGQPERYLILQLPSLYRPKPGWIKFCTGHCSGLSSSLPIVWSRRRDGAILAEIKQKTPPFTLSSIYTLQLQSWCFSRNLASVVSRL
jgi:hypothetical protein